MSISIKKTDGTMEPFNADRINKSIERACVGLLDPIAKVTQIATETNLTLYNGITTLEMDQATINAALQNVKDDIDFDKIATRLLLKTIYREVVGEYDKDDRNDLKRQHKEGFVSYIKTGVKDKRLHKDMEEKFNLEELADTLDIERDEFFQYAGLSSL